MSLSDGNNVDASATEFHESEDYPSDVTDSTHHGGFVSKSIGWMFLSIFIVIAGLTISNGYAINNINLQLNRKTADMFYLEGDMRHLIRQHDERTNRQLRESKTEIERLTKKYDQIADQESDVLLLFKRLSDQYNIMSQQLNNINLVNRDID